jgi:hypothetical protein
VEHDVAAALEQPVRELPAETDPPLASPEEFEAAAIACDEKDAGACRRAAAASELGTVVPKDLERAKTFRKVELTVLVRGCEKGAVAECLTLADRYLRGEGLAQRTRRSRSSITKALRAAPLGRLPRRSRELIRPRGAQTFCRASRSASPISREYVSKR